MCRISKYEMVCEKVKGYNTDIIDKEMNDCNNVGEFIVNVLNSDSFPQEHFMVFMLDVKNRIVGFSDVSKGTLNNSLVHPREVYIPALTTPKCAAIIIAHNHPSGDPTPSSDDIQVTDRLKIAGDILGIQLYDHVVVGDGEWVSLREQGLIPSVMPPSSVLC